MDKVKFKRVKGTVKDSDFYVGVSLAVRIDKETEVIVISTNKEQAIINAMKLFPKLKLSPQFLQQVAFIGEEQLSVRDES